MTKHESPADRLLNLAISMVAALADVRRIEKLVASHVCVKEAAWFADRESKDAPPLPCWRDALGRSRACTDYEESQNIAYDANGDWCQPCQDRDEARRPLSAARHKLAVLRSAMTRLAQRAAKVCDAARSAALTPVAG